MNDKIFGYIILSVLLLCFGSIGGYCVYILVFPKETRFITFPQVSNLRVDDPVKLKGTTVATISAITKSNNKVIVAIKTFKPLTIYRGYQIYTADKGILGDQQVILINGDSANPVIGTFDTLSGVFRPGISDVLGSAWKLKNLVIAFKQNAGVMLSGTPEKGSIISSFTAVTTSIDTFSQKIYAIASTLDMETSRAIDTLNSVTTAARTILHEMTDSIPAELHALDSQIETMETFVGKFDALVNSLSEIVLKISENALLSKDDVTPLMQQLDDIKNFIAIIRDGTARLKVQLHAGFE